MITVAGQPEPPPPAAVIRLPDWIIPPPGAAILKHTDEHTDAATLMHSLQADDFIGEGLELQGDGSWKCLVCQQQNGGSKIVEVDKHLHLHYRAGKRHRDFREKVHFAMNELRTKGAELVRHHQIEIMENKFRCRLCNVDGELVELLQVSSGHVHQKNPWRLSNKPFQEGHPR